MKLFCVTKRRLDLGFGDASWCWSRLVEAGSEQEIRTILDAAGEDDFFMTIKPHDPKGISVAEFQTFVRGETRW